MVRIDGGGGEEGERTKTLAREYQFSHGNKSVVENPENRRVFIIIILIITLIILPMSS